MFAEVCVCWRARGNSGPWLQPLLGLVDSRSACNHCVTCTLSYTNRVDSYAAGICTGG